MDGTFIILGLLVVMYLVLFLPRQRQVARQRAMQAELAPGDEVVTIGGLRGRVASLSGDEVCLEVSPGVELRFVRDAVARRLATTSPPSADEPVGPDADVSREPGSDGP